MLKKFDEMYVTVIFNIQIEKCEFCDVVQLFTFTEWYVTPELFACETRIRGSD